MRVLLSGSGGRLGTAFLNRSPEDFEILPAGRLPDKAGKKIRLNARFPIQQNLLERYSPNLIINTSALSSTVECRTDPGLAWRLNSLWPLRLGIAAESLGIGLVHFSTDLVYSAGRTGSYTEMSTAVPASLYGWSKLFGDLILMKLFPDVLILRTSVLFGNTDSGKKTFSEELICSFPEKYKVYTDCFRNHTPVHWIPSVTNDLLNCSASGLYLTASRSCKSRADFAFALFEFLHRDPAHLEKCFAPRGVPLNLCLDTSRLERATDKSCPDLRKSLKIEYPPKKC